jgi:hypothetical protein
MSIIILNGKMAALVTVLCNLDNGKQNVEEYRSTASVVFYSDSRTGVLPKRTDLYTGPHGVTTKRTAV